jgi:hypothetical protein
VQAYTLGVYFRDGEFCRAVLEGGLDIMKEAECYPDPGTITLAYEKTKKDSPLRHMLVKLYVQAGSADELDFDALTKEFLKDVFSAFLRRYKKKNWNLAAIKTGNVEEETFCEDVADEAKNASDNGTISPTDRQASRSERDRRDSEIAQEMFRSIPTHDVA